jgi:hypothetical protein
MCHLFEVGSLAMLSRGLCELNWSTLFTISNSRDKIYRIISNLIWALFTVLEG